MAEEIIEIDAEQQTQEPAPINSPLYRLELTPAETLATYQALKTYVRALTTAQEDALETVSIAVGVMKTLKPAAVEAAKMFQAAANPAK